uniref:Uncharacterized protein n=1 Tax=Percolomonas cosmopolitus TaxID=63605 RepID=A0A7S1PIE5_9EUKA|mmetsp:Transcript_3982/g.15035  ORF Transcript_3982/g.15035 Transcript_3982/m.15035 type:complete len:317 (+) Transcript_3982:486-1436(+)
MRMEIGYWDVGDVVMVVCIAFLACILVIYNAHFPLEKMEQLVGTEAQDSSPFLVAIVSFVVFTLTLPLGLLLAKFGSPSPNSASMGFISSSEIFESARTSILGVYAVLNFFMAVIIKFKLSGRPLLSSKLTSQQSTVSVPYSDELAAICNFATLQGFLIGVVLTALLDNPLMAYIALVPFLLLLSRDRFALRLWNDSYRYTVIAFAIEVILFVALMRNMSVLLPLFVHPAVRLLLLKEVILAALSVPSFVVLNLFLTQKSPPHLRVPLLALVPSALAWTFATTESVRVSGQIGAAACFLQLFTNQLYRPRDAKREL